MNPNRWHWRRVLARFGGRGAAVPPHILHAIDGTSDAAGVPVLDPCPPDVRDAFRALAWRAFAEGNPAAVLAETLLDVAGWETTRAEAPPEGRPRAQIIVPVRGAHEALRLCLACVDYHTKSENDVTLTVVMPTDEANAVGGIIASCGPGGVELCSCIARDVVATPIPQSFAANVNLGASGSESEFLVLLNSDAFVGPGWLDVLLAPFEDPDVVAVGPMGTNVSGHQSHALVHPDRENRSEYYRNPATVAQLTEPFTSTTRVMFDGQKTEDQLTPYAARRLVGFCVAVRRSAWDRVGGLDERFEGAFDDDDLSLRLSLIGKCVVVPDLLVLHAGSASFAELPDAEANYRRTLAENEVRFREKWAWILPSVNGWLDSKGVR